MLRLLRHFRLRTILGLSLALLALIAFGVLTLLIGEQASDRVEADIGESLGVLALSFRADLEHAIAARRDEILVVSHSLNWTAADRQEERESLALLHSVVPGFSWITAFDSVGRVIISTTSSLEGQQATERPWPSEGETAAKVLRVSLAVPFGAKSALLDIAAPITDRSGVAVGTLGARLNREFAGLLRRDMLDRTRTSHPQLDILVLDNTGTVIIGSPAELGRSHASWYAANAKQTGDGYGTYVWEDGSTRVIGSASAMTGLFAELNWSILVMVSSEVAFAPVSALLWRIASIGALATLAFILAGIALATITTRPLRQISAQADAIGAGAAVAAEGIQIPKAASAEIATLASSLQGMLRGLQRNEQQLREINRNLDRNVAERTAEALAARDQAIAATRSKSRFLAAASHDLRQPLQALSLLMNAIERRLPDGEAKQIGRQATAAVASLRNMFDSLLDVSKLDAGVVEAQFVSFDPAPLVSALVAEYRPLAESSGLTLRLAVTAHRPASTDPALLEAVLRNLVGNALKFTARGGILVTCRARSDGVLIQVHDTGPGIAVDRQTSVFEAFERGSEAARGDNDGLGLGLSIVTRLATTLNARLVFRSRPGRGTRIGLLMPYAQGAALEPTVSRLDHKAPLQTSLTFQGRAILLLEDDPVIRETLARALTELGAQVHAHGEIDSALATMRSQRIDLAVVDNHLRNGATGTDFVNAMTSTGVAKPKLIFLTGATDTATLSKIGAFGAPILTKPIAFDDLLRALAERLTL